MKFIKSKKVWLIGAAIILATASIITVSLINSKKEVATVSKEEIEEYRNLISDSMDIKKSILVLFETKEEADDFIQKHGNDEHPENTGLGATPYMPEGYYNLVGKTVLETEFDTMSDGEYSKEAIEYDGMFCYLKRLGIKKLSDSEISEMIKNEKDLAKSKRKDKTK